MLRDIAKDLLDVLSAPGVGGFPAGPALNTATHVGAFLLGHFLVGVSSPMRQPSAEGLTTAAAATKTATARTT